MMHGTRLSDETYEFIKGEVVFILKKCKIRCIPISGFEIAVKLGIILRPYSSLTSMQLAAARKISSDGFFIENEQGRNIIFYNDSKSYDRINMTLLHEIGHCVLDHGISAYGNSDIEEAEAKFFAKYMAAPPPLVDKIHPTDASDIMEWFQISWEASNIAFEYYLKWRRIRDRREPVEYETVMLELFVNGRDHIRKRLSAYSSNLPA